MNRSRRSIKLAKNVNNYIFYCEFLLAIDDVQLYDLIQHCDMHGNIPEMAHQRLWEKLKLSQPLRTGL